MLIADEEEVKKEEKEEPEAEKPDDALLAKAITDSIGELSKVIKDLSVSESYQAIQKAIEAIQSSTNKTTTNVGAIILELQAQQKKILEAVKEKPEKEEDDGQEYQEIIAALKSIKIPDYSKEIKDLTEAIKARPTKFTITFNRNYGGGSIVSATIEGK